MNVSGVETTIAGGCSANAFASASLPSKATSVSKPFDCSAVQYRRQTAGSASAIRIKGRADTGSGDIDSRWVSGRGDDVRVLFTDSLIGALLVKVAHRVPAQQREGIAPRERVPQHLEANGGV